LQRRQAPWRLRIGPVIPKKLTILRFFVAVFRFTSFFFCANYAVKFSGMLAFSFGRAPEVSSGRGSVVCAGVLSAHQAAKPAGASAPATYVAYAACLAMLWFPFQYERGFAPPWKDQSEEA
jgi:hypothetical protein